MDLNGDMIRGHIDTIILLSLVDGDKDSNEIRKNIEERSDNKFSVKQGTFYSAMQRLVKQSLIKEYRSSATDGIRRKYFSLTEKGEKLVETLNGYGIYNELYRSTKFMDNHTFPLTWTSKAAKENNEKALSFIKRFFAGEI